MHRVFQQAYHITGALAANAVITFTAPCNCTLLHVSAVGSNDGDATFTIGDSDDADEFLTASLVGDSGVPAEYDHDDFVDTAGNTHDRYHPRIADGTVVIVTVDFDGDGGTPTEDLTVVLTFAEG